MPTRPAGFTLIELIVSVAILSIVSAIGIAGFISFQDNQKVLSAAKEVQQLYVDAQVKARVKETPNGCSGNLVGYVVTRNGATFTLGADCGGANPVFRDSVTVSTVTIPDIFDTNMTFLTQYGDLDPKSDQRICFYNGTHMYEFTITSNAQVGDVEKATACP